jgi:folate-dependent phosphoribosylglycinamide formyltransferase PurN
MKSPLQFLAETLNETVLGKYYSLVGVINDDDSGNPSDRNKIQEYGFSSLPDRQWFYPADLRVQGHLLNDLLCTVPSTYRRQPLQAAERVAGKHEFETRLLDKLYSLEADLVVLDGLLVILDELVRPQSPFSRRIFNIHPGITRAGSPFERRGAYATLDALYGAKGLQVADWISMETTQVAVVPMTGASFHFVDTGIDSGEVVADVLNTVIDPSDSILELRWNNFENSLFPALFQGLMHLAI